VDTCQNDQDWLRIVGESIVKGRRGKHKIDNSYYPGKKFQDRPTKRRKRISTTKNLRRGGEETASPRRFRTKRGRRKNRSLVG